MGETFRCFICKAVIEDTYEPIKPEEFPNAIIGSTDIATVSLCEDCAHEVEELMAEKPNKYN